MESDTISVKYLLIFIYLFFLRERKSRKYWRSHDHRGFSALTSSLLLICSCCTVWLDEAQSGPLHTHTHTSEKAQKVGAGAAARLIWLKVILLGRFFPYLAAPWQRGFTSIHLAVSPSLASPPPPPLRCANSFSSVSPPGLFWIFPSALYFIYSHTYTQAAAE